MAHSLEGLINYRDMTAEMHSCGFASVPFPFGGQLLGALQTEALSVASSAQLFESDNPRVRKYVAPLGDAAVSFATGQTLSNVLSCIFSTPLRFAADRSGYMFLDGGCELGPHKDTIKGDRTATMIVYLFNRQFEPKERELTSNSELYTISDSGESLLIDTSEGRTVLGVGNDTTHMRSIVPAKGLLVSMNMSFTDLPL